MGVCLIIRTSGGTDTSGATATAARVLSGYTCYVNDVKITGTMTNQGTKTASLNAGGSYTIPAGYHSGSGKVTTNALSGQTSGTAGAAHILSGYNAWVNGTNTWGNMPNRGNISHSLPANGSYTIPAGWHAGGGVVNQSLAFHWGGTYTPNTANQVICWANWYAAGNIVVLGSSNLVSWNIKNGVWIFGVLGNFTGWVDSTMAMSAVPGWTVNTALDTGWHWYSQDYSDTTYVYAAWCTGNSSSLARVKWLVSNGFKPAIKATWQQTKRGSDWGNIAIEFSAVAICTDSYGNLESDAMIGNNPGRYGGAYNERFYSDTLDAVITTTWVCTAANGFTCNKYPCKGDQFWMSGFLVRIKHPTSSGQGKINSINLYWTK